MSSTEKLIKHVPDKEPHNSRGTGWAKKTPTTFRCHNSVAHWPIAFKFEHNVLWLIVDCCTNFYWISCSQFQMVTTLIQAGQHSAFLCCALCRMYVAAFCCAMRLITWISMTPSSSPRPLTCNHADFTASPCCTSIFRVWGVGVWRAHVFPFRRRCVSLDDVAAWA